YEMLLTSPLRSTVSGPIRVPASSGRQMFFKTIDAPQACAGCTDRGWSAFAPKYESSAASSYESAERGNASETIFGAEVMKPPTSFQISIVGRSRACARTEAR